MEQWLNETLAAQRDRAILWAPVAFGAGIGVYFGLKAEPPVFLTVAVLLIVAGVAAAVGRWREGRFHALWLAVVALLLAACGFADAQWRTARLNTVMLEKDIRAATVEGRIRSIDTLEGETGVRVVLDGLSIEDLPPEKTPQRIRLRVRKADDLRPGDRIRVLAGLNPPAAPAAPGAFDFQRYAYFKEIGAFGFAYNQPDIVARDDEPGASLESLRRDIGARIRKHIADPGTAAMATALITGQAAAVPDEDWEAMRIAGLAHMVSISGLHIGLVAGVFFFVSRLLMAAVPPLALRFPIKKIAAVIAFAGALFYTLLAGAPVPTVRAMIMTGIVLFAVVIDRQALSVRLIALAALVVLALWPEALWGASFQMSFAAVTALIVCYEAARPRLSALYSHAGFVRRFFLYVGGVCATTIIASAAVDPFSLYHFQQIGLYSLPANVAASAPISFIIMPAAVLACLLMPFGLEHWPLWAMGEGVAFVLRVAHEVASLPAAAVHFHAVPLPVLLWFVGGALAVLFWKGWRGKVAGLVPMIAAIVMALTYRPPDILVSADAKLLAVRGAEDGTLYLSSRVNGRFSAETWRRMNGEDPDTKPPVWPKEGADPATGLTCDEDGCTMTRDGKTAAFSFFPHTQAEDCARADILIARDPLIDDCRTGLAVGRFDTYRNGAYAVWLDGHYETIASTRGVRPWTMGNGR